MHCAISYGTINPIGCQILASNGVIGEGEEAESIRPYYTNIIQPGGGVPALTSDIHNSLLI